MASAKVLVIDDDDSIVDLLSAYLTQEGFRVDVARDGAVGLAKVRQFQPDVVVLDIMLPGLDDLEVLRRLSGWHGGAGHAPGRSTVRITSAPATGTEVVAELPLPAPASQS